MKQHPLSAAFPPMTDAEFAELRADIAVNGLHQAITTYQDAVLDGWHRYCACDQSGTEPKFVEFTGSDAAARRFVVSANLMRRHLDTSERSMIAGKFANMPHGGDRKSGKDQGANSPLDQSVAEAAALLNVSERSVKDARAVLAADDRELIAQVESGQVSVSRAASTVRKKNKANKAKERKAQPLPMPKASQANITYLPSNGTTVTVEQWKRASADQQRLLLQYRNPKAVLNRQKSAEDANLIDWAKWSWNPIVGCLHDCPYCYARDIAERFRDEGVASFANGFVPTLHPGRLSAPLSRTPPQSEDEREARIFTGSMADLFGRWVPPEWIETILGIAAEARQWEFLMLTKFPKRMAEFRIPNNVWMGTTVDCQARVAAAEEAFGRVNARVRWLSVEPMLEPLKFEHLDRFNLLVIGGASRSSKTPRWIPPYEWLADLMRQADEANCAVYLKSNLYRKEAPFGARYRFTEKLPKVFDYLGRKVGEGAA